jgi:hypothetical protein
MRHANLFFAAAVLFGSVAAAWAEPLPASNSTEISTRDLGPSPITVPADATAAPAVVPPPSPVAEIAVDPGMKGAPQEVKSGPIRDAAHAVVPPHRPVTHRARLGCFSSHHSTRGAKFAVQARVAAPQATVWLAASREPRYVLLGVGF